MTVDMEPTAILRVRFSRFFWKTVIAAWVRISPFEIALVKLQNWVGEDNGRVLWGARKFVTELYTNNEFKLV